MGETNRLLERFTLLVKRFGTGMQIRPID